ncbi:MAG: rhodanese-like domain-containing protein [Phycisphaerae bacterium]|nr:rhodanese-like domain-containing protein [Phycisphaerae bacterium]
MATQTAMGIREIEPREAADWVRSGRAVLVDVREPDEYAAERIEGATLVPLSRFEFARLPSALEAPVVFHCRSGRRSLEAAARASGGGWSGVYNLKGGIEAWKGAGLPVIRTRAPISIMRQVQIVVGAGVLAGSVLAWLVSPWFLLLTGFFGAGLLFAGSTGMCGMAAVLGAMPWNRALRPGGASCAGGSCGA